MINFIKKELIMFNGIIFNTGKVKSIKKTKNSILLELKQN